MSDDSRVTLARLLPRLAIGVAGTAFLLAACAPTPTPTPERLPSPVASAAPSAVRTPSPIPSQGAMPRPSSTSTPASVAPTADPFAGIPPLPGDLRLPDGDFTVRPESARGLALNTIVPYDLGHCGLYSPVDLDGSLWEPIAGTDGEGGPVDEDDEVGQLINGTPGQAILVTAQRLDWRSTQGTPVVVVFQRIPGERGYPGCM
jgi:hypothetical protein